MDIFFHTISLCLDFLAPPSSLRRVTQLKRNKKYQENKFILGKQIFACHLHVQYILLYEFSDIISINTYFYAFLVFLSTCCREDWQVPFGIHFCGDRSLPDCTAFAQSLWERSYRTEPQFRCTVICAVLFTSGKKEGRPGCSSGFLGVRQP